MTDITVLLCNVYKKHLFINPQCTACTARVTVVILCVCACVYVFFATTCIYGFTEKLENFYNPDYC